MSNGTQVSPKLLRERLETMVDTYRGILLTDERRLHDAMLEFERSCWATPQKCTV